MYVNVRVPGDSREFIADGEISSEFELLNIETAEIDEYIKGFCTDPVNDAIDAAAYDGFFTSQELADIGIDFIFDSTTLSAEIKVPLNLVGESVLYVKGQRKLPDYKDLNTSRFSMALPLWIQYDSKNNLDGKSAVYSGELTVSPAIVIRDWVLESNLLYLQGESVNSLDITKTHLLYDFTRLGFRGSVGQVTYPVRGFQGSEALLGLAVVPEDFGVDGISSGSLFESLFEIEETSTVNVYINDRLLRSFRLDPGKYSFEDFPLSSGFNNVRIDIIDRFGEIETITTDVPYASQLLSPGELLYSCAVGFRDWDFDETALDAPLISGYVRRGMIQELSIGGNLQSTLDWQMLGLESVYASPWGIIQPHVALSLNEYSHVGSAFLLQYSIPSSIKTNIPSISLSSRFQSNNFRLLGDDGDDDRLQWANSISLAQPLPGKIGMLVGFSHRSYYNNEMDAQIFAGLNRTFGGIFSLRLSAQWEPFESLDEWEVGLNVTIREPSNRVNMTSYAKVPENRIDINASGTYITELVKGNASLGVQNISFSDDSGVDRVNAKVSAETHRIDTSIYTDLDFNKKNSQSSLLDEFSYGIRSGTGLYYADGLLGIGKATRSGFIVARNSKSLPADGLMVNPTNKGSNIQSDWMGPLVISGYSPYSPKALNLEPTGIPADYSLGNTNYIYHPRYRSGVGVEVTGTSKVYIKGVLIDSGGFPIELKGLVIVPLFEPDLESLGEATLGSFSFTDETGAFEVYGLIPGEYLVMVQGHKEQSVKIIIESSEERFQDLGEISAGYYMEDF